MSQQDLAGGGKAAYQLHQDFSQCSDQARLPSMNAAGDIEDQGFALGAALDHVAEHWVDQVQSLLDATAQSWCTFARSTKSSDNYAWITFACTPNWG